MSALSDIGKALLGSDIQAQATEAAQQLQVAVATAIALEAIVAIELFIVIVMLWKDRH